MVILGTTPSRAGAELVHYNIHIYIINRTTIIYLFFDKRTRVSLLRVNRKLADLLFALISTAMH